MYKQAIQLCSVDFPHAKVHAVSLHNLGAIYYNIKSFDEAEPMYQSALQLYSTHFPQSKKYSLCLSSMGIMCLQMNRSTEAEQLFVRAQVLLSTNPTETEKCSQGVRRLREGYVESEESPQKRRKIKST